MTWERWRELMQAAPAITREDAKRLATFKPQLSPLAVYVRMALADWTAHG